jgi:type I restriction enzyme, R subunit
MYSELKNVEIPLVKTLEKLGWEYAKSAELDGKRASYDNPFILYHLKDAILKLNADKGIAPDQADAIINKLQREDSNEEFSKWLKGEKSFKLSQSEKAVTIKLIDSDNLANNTYTVTNQFRQTITNGKWEDYKHIRPDIVLLINGIPVVVIECKFLGTEGSTWQEGIKQLDRYQRHSPKLFISNCFNVSTDGHMLKYGATGSPSKFFFEWKYDNGLPADFDESTSEFQAIEDSEDYNPYIDKAVYGLFNHNTVLDLLNNFIVFETVDNETIKKISRYQQYRATNKVVERVIEGKMHWGLVWHTQGSGKSLTMLFTAWKLRKLPQLNNPTVLIVVDRVDLDTQISGTFAASKLPNTTRAKSVRDLRQKLLDDRREVIISTVFKFNDLKDILIERGNIIVLIDEAHRSQEGKNAIEMRHLLKNAFLFGYTGTPIDRADRNTHRNFGMRDDGDVERYIDLYNIRQAIEDGATVPVHYQLRNSKWHMDGADLDKIAEDAYGDILEEDELHALKKKAGKFGTFMMKPERLESIAQDIAGHFRDHVEPNGYKAQVVCFNRKACVIIKEHLDELLGDGVCNIIYTGAQNDEEALRRYHYSGEKQKEIVRSFKNQDDSLKILLVQSMLLTGFDAPVEQVMYLDRPLKDHTLLQAIARTNRPYQNKQSGIIIDYCGVLKNLREALNFNENDIEGCLIDFDELKRNLPDLIDEFMNFFRGINMDNLAACLKHIEKNKLESDILDTYKRLQLTYETIAPDPFVLEFYDDYKMATQIVLAWKQMSNDGEPAVDDEYLANTKKLIQEHIDVSAINQAAPIFVVDDNYLRRIDELPPDPEHQQMLIEKRLRSVLVIRLGNLPVYKTLMERLDSIIEQKNLDIQQSIGLLTELTGNVNEAMKEESDMKLSKGELAINQLVTTKTNYAKPDELASRLTNIIAEHTFPGWQNQPSVQATIKRDIIIGMAEYAKENDDSSMDPDEYSKFGMEAMKYVEQHFSG